MFEPLETISQLTNTKMQFTVASKSNPPIVTDYVPPLGDGAGYMPLEVFLASLSTCVSGALINLLRRMRKDVRDIQIKTLGIRNEEHPTGFKTIKLELLILSENAEESDVEKAISLSEEKYCPVLAMIKGNVEVSYHFVIKKP